MLLLSVIWAVDLSLRPYIIKLIVNKVTSFESGDLFSEIKTLSVIYFSLLFSVSTCFRLYDYFVNYKMIPLLRNKIANDAMQRLLEQSYSYYQNNFAGSLTNKVNDLINNIPELIQLLFDRFFSSFLALLIAIFALYKINFIFAFIMFTWSFLFISGSILLSKRLSKLSFSWSEINSKITGKLVDKLSNIVSIRLFARKKETEEEMRSVFTESVIAEQNFMKFYFIKWLGYGYLFILLSGCNLYFLIDGINKGLLTAGDFVMVLTINIAVADFLWRLAHYIPQFARLLGKVSQALTIISVKPEIKDIDNAKELKVIRGEIKFDQVNFSYRQEHRLFEQKSIIIPAGQKVGLVGVSGSGKSTFVNLLLRFFNLNSGAIFIDDQDISKVSQESLRASIAMIPQDPSLFHTSLLENIKFGRLNANDEEIILASKYAHAHEFISSLPDKYDTIVGERGVKLSGGQRQRIALARAFLKNSPILILDEATSQLDSVTETIIQDILKCLMSDKTTIVIAHRLSTLMIMDRILVFDKGKIVGDGTHKQLLKNCELYNSLWSSQVEGMIPESLY